MNDKNKTQKQLIAELDNLRQRIVELEEVQNHNTSERDRIENILEVEGRQQAVIAEMGQNALSGTDISVLMDKAVNFIVKNLNLEYCKILELLPDGNTFLLKAGVGWKKGLVGSAIVDAGINSQAGYTLLSDNPVIVEDLNTEIRFRGPSLLFDHGVVSGMSVIISGRTKPYGVLGAHTIKRRVFTHDNVHFLQSMANIMAVAIERKQAEDAIRENKELLQSIIDNTTSVIYLKDIEGRFILVNRRFENLFNITKEKVIGKTDYDIWPKTIADKFRENDRKVLKAGGPLEVEEFAPHMDGIHTYITVKFLLYDNNGVSYAVGGISTDITERRRADDEIQKIHKLESIGILAGGIAHDFNNMLTTILGNISLSKMYLSPGDKIYGRLTDAENACEQAKELTHRLLTFSKGGELFKKVVLISEILHESVSTLLKNSNINFEFILPDEHYLAEADEELMRQVFNNIVINNKEAMPEGGTLTVSAKHVVVSEKSNLPLKEGNYIKITFKDNGKGIPEGNLLKIFDPFFTTKEMGSEKGMGLGLTVCYSIVNKHDGFINVDSRVGEGTAFHIYLPAFEKLTKDIEEVSTKSKGRILIMDDEVFIRNTAGKILGYVGYEVEYAKDGEEAVVLYSKAKKMGCPFDVVILDLTIPTGMGGEMTIKRLLNIDPKVKGIVSSGYSNEGIMNDFKKYGFAGAIIKPYTFAQLSETVARVIMEAGKSS